MTEQAAPTYSVLVWISERTWQACIDAARRLPAGPRITLIHVIADDPQDAAHGAYLGLMGRRPSGRDPGALITEFADNSAAELLDGAARRLGRPCDRTVRHGRPEREVVAAAAGADLLILARDGDQSRLGPKSLGREPRFVVDHAPCPVLLIWPGPAPSVGTIPPKPPEPPPPAGPPGPHEPPSPPD